LPADKNRSLPYPSDNSFRWPQEFDVSKILEILKRFDDLPDDALVPPKVAGIVLDVNEHTLRRHPPVPRIQVSPQRYRFRVGNLRALVRGRNP
jgi:hypothetical protein